MSGPAEPRDAVADPLVSTVLDAVGDPAVVCDPSGRVRDWNGELAARFEPAPGAGTATLADLVDCPSDPLARAVETGEETIGNGALAATGGEATAVCRPVERDGEVTAVVVTLSASTDLLEDERALYEASVDAAADAVYVVDRSYTILTASDGFTRFTGVPTDRVEGRDVDCLRELGIVDGEVFHEGVRALRALFAGEDAVRHITSEVRLDGEDGVVENRMSPIERDGEVVAVVNVVRDVTERERRREALATNRERLATVMEDLPVVMVAVDGDGRVDHCQGFDFDALTCDRGDVVGEPVERFDSVCPSIVDGFERALDGERATETATVGDRTYKVCIEPLSSDDAAATAAGADGAPGAIAVAVDVTDRTRRESELRAREQELRAVIESSADPIAMQDVEGRYRVVNQAMLADLETDRESVVSACPEEVFSDDFAQRIEAHRRAVLETERARVVEERLDTEGDGAVVQLTFAPYRGPDGAVRGTVSIARDITELERQRDELETLAEIQELIQESVRALTGATTSEAIKETVCDRLVESEFYEFAWVGERVPGEPILQREYTAGEGGDYLEATSRLVDTTENGRGPATAAYRTGEIQAVHDVRSDPDFEPWREAALESGFESMICVPLTHGSTTHGLLGVYADRPNAFSRRKLGAFETLGEAVGFALSAAQYRRLVETDSVLELEFEVRGETPFNEASREHDCRFVIDQAVRTSDEQVVAYLTVEGADREVAERAAQDLPNLERLRPLDVGGGPDFEMTLTDSVFQYLADVGARGERGIVEDGVGHMMVEAPADADVRVITDAMDDRFPTVDLVAKREKQRDTTWWQSHDDISAALTDRQRAVLKTAYYNGYYEWPRDVDSETLADSLDIASTTLLQHLRKGHRRVLEAMFDA